MRKTTAHFIEQRRAVEAEVTPSKENPKGPGPGKHPNSIKAIKKHRGPQWVKGQSGNPSGLPGVDKAALAARRFFDRFPDITPAMAKALRGFNAYGWAVLASSGPRFREADGKVPCRNECGDIGAGAQGNEAGGGRPNPGREAGRQANSGTGCAGIRRQPHGRVSADCTKIIPQSPGNPHCKITASTLQFAIPKRTDCGTVIS